MALPTFICVGAEKAGTTPLAAILRQHHDIYLTPNKETHFFSRMYDFENLAFYETFFFKEHNGERAVGELTPIYMRHKEVPARLRQHLSPDLKLIFCLRDPVKRALSHYHQSVRILEESESFPNAIALEQARLEKNYYCGLRRAYIGAGLYAAQIQRYLDLFPRENMFFIILEEDFQKNRAQTVSRLFDFLGVGDDPKVNLEVPVTSLVAPTIRFIKKDEHLSYKSPRHTRLLAPGAVIFNTGIKGSDRVTAYPSPQVARFFHDIAANLTRELSDEDAHQLYRRYFHDEIGLVETLLDRDLSVWRR